MSLPSRAKRLAAIPPRSTPANLAMPLIMPTNAAEGTSFAWIIEPLNETHMIFKLAIGRFTEDDVHEYFIKSSEHDELVSLNADITLHRSPLSRWTM